MELSLTRSWIVWHDTNWDDLKSITGVQTVCAFWQLFNALPTAFPHLNNIRWFREGIHPSREDPQHVTGGKWIIQFQPGQESTGVWLNLLLDLIGSTIPQEASVTGIEFNARRRGDRISIWTNTSLDQMELGQYLMQQTKQSVDFKEHHEIAEYKSSYVVKSLIQLKHST